MKYLLVIMFLSPFVTIVRGQEATGFSLIPQPVSVKVNQGSYVIDIRTRLFISPVIDRRTADLLCNMLREATGCNLPLTADTSCKSLLSLELNEHSIAQLGKEGYTLYIASGGIQIAANEVNGLFYGLQSLLQFLPVRTGRIAAQADGVSAEAKTRWSIPAVAIIDYPRFNWRGYMLDVSRHFFPKPFILSLIDEMARYKFNVFHWHLTDDQGWRVEIKSLPNLTKTGAWRVHRTGGHFEFLEKPQPGEEATDGGFYSQDDIREIVAYAASRFITILPEIDVPAHSSALIASYPNISCRQLPMFVNPGSPITAAEDNVLCVANDSTWLILDKVLTEISQLFPGEYIHIGGDEANMQFWDSCAKCQKLMHDRQLKDPAGLQSFFINKLSAMLRAKGKKMIGWEEIMQGGLAPDAAVMSWTSIDAGVKAARMGHGVIMAPWDHGLYMDKSRIALSYGYDPLPSGVDPQFIWGAEACLWTEDVPHVREVERMFWPRAMALAEVFWSPLNRKDWDSFRKRMEKHLLRLDVLGVNYSKMLYEPRIMAITDRSNVFGLSIETEINGLTIYYSFDNTDPDECSSKYEGRILTIPRGAVRIKAISYRNGKPIGKQIDRRLTDLRKREDPDNEDD